MNITTDMPHSLYRYIFQNSYGKQALVVILTLILLPLAPIPLELQRRMLDDAVANGNVYLLLKLSGLYLLAMLVSACFKFAMRTQRELISAHIVRTLRSSVFYGMHAYEPELHSVQTTQDLDKVDEGAVVSMLSSEVEKLGGFAGSAISGPLFATGTLFFVLGYMFWVEPFVAAIALVFYLPQFIIVPVFQTRMNRLAQQKALKMRTLGSFMVDLPKDEFVHADPPKIFVNLVEDILRIRTRFILNKNVMKVLNNLLIALGPFGVISYGGYLAIQGTIEVGVILAFVSGLERLSDPIRDLIGSYSQITDARMRYSTLLDAFPKPHINN